MLEISDATQCGIGEGANCCAFLTVGQFGFVCGRTDVVISAAVRLRLHKGTMTAIYDPGGVPHPKCQEERPRGERSP